MLHRPDDYNAGMAILKVARMGHPVLRARARAVDPGQIRSPVIQRLIDDMFDTMREYQGVGLAAPQVHESVRIFVAGFAPSPEDDEEEDDEDDDRRVPLMALINPEITPASPEVVEDWEGCLSIPDLRGRVPRARQITVRAYDRKGKRIEVRASGFTARVIQHETDHLDGVLFLDRMKSFGTLTFLDEFGRYWSRQEVEAE
jgi:peptide deformylase